MRKLSFLSLSCIAMLALSSCSKEEITEPPLPITQQEPTFKVSSSSWTSIDSLSWAESASYSVPNQQATWNIPELSEDLLNTGTTVLIFSKSNDTEIVLPMPSDYVSGATDNIIDRYEQEVSAAKIVLSHTRNVDGIYETPAVFNNISFRYIIITETTPPVFGRSATTDFRSMSYEDLIAKLNIPG